MTKKLCSANILALNAKIVNGFMEKMKIKKLTTPESFRGANLQDIG